MGLLLTLSLGFTLVNTMLVLPTLLGMPPERRRANRPGSRDSGLPERRQSRDRTAGDRRGCEPAMSQVTTDQPAKDPAAS